jgi:DNA-binding NarL/FixJ family response regulator
MNTIVEPVRLQEQLNVLLVGNNPIELSSMLNKISSVPGRLVTTETAFDTKSIFDRLIKFRPNFILIDDNIGKYELNETVLALANNRKTKNVPITVLKNSNYAEANSSLTILDYILKKSLTTEALYNAIRNSIKIKRTQLYLYKAYNKRKGMLTDLLRGK